MKTTVIIKKNRDFTRMYRRAKTKTGPLPLLPGLGGGPGAGACLMWSATCTNALLVEMTLQF